MEKLPSIKEIRKKADEEIEKKTEQNRRTLYFFPAFLVLLLCLILVLGGCKTGFGVGMDAELFYPDIKTAKGGVFSDPVGSREQSTQHTTGMARNNLPMVGGGK